MTAGAVILSASAHAEVKSTHDYQQKLQAVYSSIAALPPDHQPDEIDRFGNAALALTGEARIYAVWRVLNAFKTDDDEAGLKAWHDKVAAKALSDGDSRLDLLARFMLNAYHNEAGSFTVISEREWSDYLAASDPAFHNIVILERQRQLQFQHRWAEAIDLGDSLLIRLRTGREQSAGALIVALQNQAYNMIRVGDFDAYANQMLEVSRLIKTDAFFSQRLDAIFSLGFFSAQDGDVVLAKEYQSLYSRLVAKNRLPGLLASDQELCAAVADAAREYAAVVNCLRTSPAAVGVVEDGHEAYKLKLLTRAYANLYDVKHTEFYLQKLKAIPDGLFRRDPIAYGQAEALIAAGEGRHKEAVQMMADLIPVMKQTSDETRIAAIQDMYKALRKELDSKTAEARLLNQQVQLRNWLLITAGAVVLLLIAIGAGTTVWVVRMGRMQWRLKEASDHAEAANAAKSRFLAVMSHELRTPLNGVLGMAQALKRDALTEDQRAKVDTLAESGETLLMLLNDVLDMSRIEAGKVELSPTPASMKDMIERVFNTFAPTIGEKPVALRYDLDPTAAQALSFDVLRVYQCLSNLVSNAVKFTNEGVIRVVASAEKHLDKPGYTVRVEVRDTGIGISKAGISKLFEAYSQADASTARKYGGSGLGLSITRRLTELMGGSVSVTSEEGAGSVFVMTFEAGEVAPAATDAAAETTPEDVLPHGVRILLVDDHPVNRKVARLFLEPFGFDITEAVDGQEALDAGMEDYDLVLMDVNMPRLGGIDATRQFRASETPGKHVPIVALTADALPEQIEACLSAGMDAHVSKPIVMDKLIDTVVSLLGENAVKAAQTA